MLFFFFKQKTAYEMRISDWSSDVCSSDLPDGRDPPCLDRPSGRSDTGQSHGSRQAPAISHRRRDDRRDLLQRDERGEPPVSGQPLLSPFELRRTLRTPPPGRRASEIGSASCRERVCPYV